MVASHSLFLTLWAGGVAMQWANQSKNPVCVYVCLADSGMVVGHQRTTQTRGVWLWSKQIPVLRNATVQGSSTAAAPLSLLFFDTEGFESTGQSGAYDDRIFAFAAIISSTLVYNLAEAVRESDIEKLSFAVELATAFYPRYQAPRCAHNAGSLSLCA